MQAKQQRSAMSSAHALASPEAWAAQYKLYNPDGSPHSNNIADLLLLGSNEGSCAISSYQYCGQCFEARLVGSLINVSNKGWRLAGGAWDSPWQSVEMVDFVSSVKPASLIGWFAGCSKLSEIHHIELLNTSAAQSLKAMFAGCSSLAALDVSAFNTSHVTTFESMFEGCSSLRVLNVSSFDTSSATTFMRMFSGCSSLRDLNVSGLKTSKAKSFFAMFEDCSSLASLDVSSFDTSSAATLSRVFKNCSSLKSIDVSHFKTKQVSSFGGIFDGCSALESLDLSNFSFCSTNTIPDFKDCPELKQIKTSRILPYKVHRKIHSFAHTSQAKARLVCLQVSFFMTRAALSFTIALVFLTLIWQVFSRLLNWLLTPLKQWALSIADAEFSAISEWFNSLFS